MSALCQKRTLLRTDLAEAGNQSLSSIVRSPRRHRAETFSDVAHPAQASPGRIVLLHPVGQGYLLWSATRRAKPYGKFAVLGFDASSRSISKAS